MGKNERQAYLKAIRQIDPSDRTAHQQAELEKGSRSIQPWCEKDGNLL
jgi:hypothetical protein